MEMHMNLWLAVSAVLFGIAAIIVGFVRQDVVGASILGGIAAYVAAGAGFPRVVTSG